MNNSFCEYNGKGYGCGGDNCRVMDNSQQENWQLNNFFSLGNVDGKSAQGFNNDVAAPKRTKALKENGSAVSTFELQAHPGTVQTRSFVNNTILTGYRAPRQRTNATGGQLLPTETPLFIGAVYKGNGPQAIEVESSLRFKQSRGGSDKSCRTIMTKDFNRFERDLRFNPQRLDHVVHSQAGLPPRGGVDVREYDMFCQDDRQRVDNNAGRHLANRRGTRGQRPVIKREPTMTTNPLGIGF